MAGEHEDRRSPERDSERKHDQIWNEISKLRERQHELASHLLTCEEARMRMTTLEGEYRKHVEASGERATQLAVLKTSVETIKDGVAKLVGAEEGRTAKIALIVGAVCAVVTPIVMVLIEIVKAARVAH